MLVCYFSVKKNRQIILKVEDLKVIMNNDEFEEMLDWLGIANQPSVQSMQEQTPNLQDMIRKTQKDDNLKLDEYTTPKHVVVNDIAYFEQMALILNLYYHATTGAKMLSVVDLDNNPDSIQMHLENQPGHQ